MIDADLEKLLEAAAENENQVFRIIVYLNDQISFDYNRLPADANLRRAEMVESDVLPRIDGLQRSSARARYEVLSCVSTK